MTTISIAEINYARKQLTHYMIVQADHVAKILGFGYEPVENAPSSLLGIKTHYGQCLRKRTPFPVYSGGSDKTIYTSAEGNYAFRFWHDIVHFQEGANFTAQGEAVVNARMCSAVAEKFGKRSLEYKLFSADTHGQIAYYQIHGKYVENQLDFAVAMVLGEF